MPKKIAIGSDHAGFELKEHIKALLRDAYDVEDVGTNSEESCDYPDYAIKVADSVLKNNKLGILICGTGIGMCMTANKIHGIRAALAKDAYMAEMARKHNDANVLCMGGRTTSPEDAEIIVHNFLTTEFEGGRHEKRVQKIMAAEKHK
ncbi:MAG TPA: ribose 5-phosphate isomerase B [Candidatus Nanoarchaeia archaeon]|nr:ribose 5-phosphate isomerase B [Candidatus Nanoarchaeia archaeon]